MPYEIVGEMVEMIPYKLHLLQILSNRKKTTCHYVLKCLWIMNWGNKFYLWEESVFVHKSLKLKSVSVVYFVNVYKSKPYLKKTKQNKTIKTKMS